MESNKLSVLEKSLPLKAYPEKSLDQILHTEFMYWLSNLLSLKEDKEEEVLNALPSVKYHFHSLGLNEVKRAFEMYAMSQMSIKPISNHFNTILVGQIFQEYKSMKPREKKPIDEKKIMEDINRQHIFLFFKGFAITGFVNDCYIESVYRFLENNNFISLTKEEKLKLMKDSEVLIILEQKEKSGLKGKLEGFKVENIKDEDKVFQSKKLAVKSFLKTFNKDVAKDIENVLNSK